MKKTILLSVFIIIVFSLVSFKQDGTVLSTTKHISTADTVLFEGEKHFSRVQQLTFGGDNAEAYFSYDGQWLVFQRTNPKEGILCDEMFIGKIPTNPGEKFEPRKISSGSTHQASLRMVLPNPPFRSGTSIEDI